MTHEEQLPEIVDEGNFAWCLRCRGVTRGRCRCMMYQDGIDTSACSAHRHVGHTGACSCKTKLDPTVSLGR